MADGKEKGKGKATGLTKKEELQVELQAKALQYLEELEKGMAELENLKKEGERGRSVRIKEEEMMQKFAKWSVDISKKKFRDAAMKALERGPGGSHLYCYHWLRFLIGSFNKYAKGEEPPVEIGQSSLNELLDRLSEAAKLVIALKRKKKT